MHVVFVHDKPLPVATYGGTERILFWLMKSLAQKGLKVTLVGHPQSNVEAYGIKLVPIQKNDWQKQIPKDADLVNLFFPWHQELSKPYICRIGGNGKPGEKFPQNTIFVSKSHAQNHGAECFVYNGIDFDEYPDSLLKDKGEKSHWNSFAFLAKASWKVKNLKDCVRAVKNTKKSLHIGGGKIWTLSSKIHSYGMVDQEKKFKIFSKTDALLWPIRWPEPFGIAMIEAMSAGLPVIASNHGSSGEVISNEVGIVCDNYQDFENAIRCQPRTFYPKLIREYTREHFSSEKMCKGYIACYEKVLSGQKLNSKVPVSILSKDAQTLLPF